MSERVSEEDLCECEKESQSEYSPGLVLSSEVIVRLIFSPLHIDNGEVLSTAFSDVERIGLSVNRRTYCTNDDLRDLGLGKERLDHERGKIDRKFVGFVCASVSDVRSAVIESLSRRPFCVIDTALPDNAAHADVICEQSISLTNSQKKKLRRILQREIFESRLKEL